MEHSQANIDPFRSDNEKGDLIIIAHVSHAIELYSPEGLATWTIVKLTLKV